MDFRLSEGKANKYKLGATQFSPHPTGVSGGGLWTIPVDPQIPIILTNVKLIGIMTDYFDRSDQVVCATNIALVRDIIQARFMS